MFLSGILRKAKPKPIKAADARLTQAERDRRAKQAAESLKLIKQLLDFAATTTVIGVVSGLGIAITGYIAIGSSKASDSQSSGPSKSPRP